MKTHRLPKAFALVIGLLGLSIAFAAGDDEEREYQVARNRQVLRDNCLICHSEEIISAARLTPAQWKAEVEKMVGWGAPLAKEQGAPLIEFLSREYASDTPAPEVKRMTYRQALAQVEPEEAAEPRSQGDPLAGAQLYTVNCANCHGPTAEGAELGPNLVEKSFLLRPTEYQDVVRRGRRRMPGFQTVLKPEQEQDMLAWLRQRRY